MEVTRRDLVRAGLALCATSAVSGSAIARADALLFTNSGIASAEAHATAFLAAPDIGLGCAATSVMATPAAAPAS